jgi:hypothetical protein
MIKISSKTLPAIGDPKAELIESRRPNTARVNAIAMAREIVFLGDPAGPRNGKDVLRSGTLASSKLDFTTLFNQTLKNVIVNRVETRIATAIQSTGIPGASFTNK